MSKDTGVLKEGYILDSILQALGVTLFIVGEKGLLLRNIENVTVLEALLVSNVD